MQSPNPLMAINFKNLASSINIPERLPRTMIRNCQKTKEYGAKQINFLTLQQVTKIILKKVNLIDDNSWHYSVDQNPEIQPFLSDPGMHNKIWSILKNASDISVKSK